MLTIFCSLILTREFTFVSIFITYRIESMFDMPSNILSSLVSNLSILDNFCFGCGFRGTNLDPFELDFGNEYFLLLFRLRSILTNFSLMVAGRSMDCC